MSVNRRLIQYAALFKRRILLALAMLVIAVSAGLAGPFVAKDMINRHITGIEQTWYQTQPGPKAVRFDGHWYERGDYFQPGQTRGPAATLIQADQDFYFVPRSLPYVTNPSVHSGELTVRQGTGSVTAPAIRISKKELFDFYKPEIPGIWKLALVYLGLLVVSAVFTYGQQLVLQVSANRILQRMRQDVFRQIHRLPIRYFDNTPAGKVVSRITNDTEAVRDLYVNVLANVISNLVTMVGIYVALFLLNVQIALICMLLIPLLAAWVLVYQKAAVSMNHRLRSLLSEINSTLNETIQGIPVIRAFNRQERTLAEFDALNQDYFKGQIKLLAINSVTGYNLVGALRNAFFIALIAYFGYRSMHLAGVISFGSLYAIVDLLNRLFQPVTQVVNQLATLEQARVSAERVFQLLDEPGVDVVDGAMPPYRGDVVFDNVFFSYDGRHNVLKGISFEALRGQTVALVGHTGSGKSSIMNLLFRFYDPQSGRISIDGLDISELPRQHLRKHMGIVLQDPFLFTGTIATNVSLGDPSVARERIERALREVGAQSMLESLPNGLDEPVLEKGSTLSAGQRQLISFARALAFDPAILVLDEATSSIDTETESVIQRALEVVKRGRTTFVIAHRLSTIRNADLILVLDKGVIVERGTHEDLIEKGGRYYQMYQMQQGAVPV